MWSISKSKAGALALLAGLAAGSVHGQAFEPGYLVTTAGDTLRGELENRFWQQAPIEVVFRSAPGQPRQLYPRARLRAFKLAGGRLFRHEVLPVDRAARTQIGSLPQRLIINQQPDTLLAEVLVDGPVPLLRANLENINHYYVQRPGRPFLEMAERRYLAMRDGREQVLDGNNYREQLKLYFADCPSAVAVATSARFSARDLAGVVQTFSANCTDSRQPGLDLTAQSWPQGQVLLNWGVLAGGRYNRVQLRQDGPVGEEAPLLDGLGLDGRLHPVGGLYLDVLLPGRHWLAHTEVALSTFGRRGVFERPGADGLSYRYAWHGTHLNVRVGGRYVLAQRPQRSWFAGAGADFDITTSSESGASYGGGSSRLTSRNVRVPTRSAFIGSPPLNMGLYLEAGLRQGRATLSADAALMGDAGFRDPLLVQAAVRLPGNTTGETNIYNGYTYRRTQLTGRVVLAWQLNRRTK